MKSLYVQTRAEVLRVFRNKRFIVASIISPLIFYVIFTKVVNSGPDTPKWWPAHYLMSMASFSIMGSAIFTLGLRLVQERTQGWSILLQVTPLKGSYYYLAKMAAQLFVNAISIIVIFTAGYFINQVELSWSAWLFCGLWILIASIPFLALGTVLGNFKKIDTASMIGNILYLGMASLGGLWMPVETMPKSMQHFAKVLPSYRFGDGAWSIVDGKPIHWISALILFGYFIAFVLLSSYIRKRQEAV